MKRRIIFAVFIGLFISEMSAQYYSSGADPFSTKWRQIQTENFQIIFPAEYETKAQEFASKMDYAYTYVNKSLSAPVRKLSVIIHSQTAKSNGMMAWVPRRMELWTVPSQDGFNYSQEWMEQLILHETRHFVQENNMNQGLTKVLSFILGEQAEMIPFGMMSRLWFLEGDAVATETALSHAGRGRMPSFEQGLRALTLEKGKQNYDVAHLGTYNFFMPNYYNVGFHTVAVNRLFRDSALFDNKIDDIGNFRTLRGFRDSRKIQYYGFAIDYLQKEWQRQDDELEKSSYETIMPNEKLYHTYEFLQADEGKFYAFCTTLTKIPQIIEIDSVGKKRIVAEPGWKSEPDFSVRNGKMVYADIIPDARWEQRSFADLFITGLHNERPKRLTRKQVYQSPCLNTDASKIVAQNVDGNGVYQLHIVDAQSGKVLEKIPNDINQFYFSPKWADDDTKIVYVAQKKDRKSLEYYDLKSGEEVVLVNGTYGEMAHPVWDNGKVYFTASYSGINNIYVCDVLTKEVKRVTSVRFGADFATVCNGDLYYADYTSDGFKPVKYVASDVAGESLSDVKYMGLGLGDKLTEQEGGAVDFSKVPDTTYSAKRYSRFLHLLNIHSWFPGIYSNDDGDNYATLSLLSQNKLSTSFLTATYDGNPANSDEKFCVDYTYNGFYPKLSMEVSWGSFDGVFGGNRIAKVNDVKLRPTVSLPLTYKSGAYYIYFTNYVFGEYAHSSNDEYEYSEDYFSRGFYSVLMRTKQSATRDLFSPIRQQVSFYMSYNDNGSYNNPYRMAANAKLYIPGVLENHSLQLKFNWQKKDIENSNAVSSLPRGYSSNLNSQLSYVSMDYYFPLFYPDVHLGSLMNIRRCSMGLYGDLSRIIDMNDDQELSGVGGSLFFDMNFLRYEVDVRLGVQAGVASYTAEDDLIYPVNLIFSFNIF